MPYKWTRDKPLHRLSDSDVTTGEVFEASDAVQDTFGEWLEPVEPDTEAAEADSGAGGGPEYSEMAYSELRQIASDADTDEINGRSSKDEIVAWLEANR